MQSSEKTSPENTDEVNTRAHDLDITGTGANGKIKIHFLIL